MASKMDIDGDEPESSLSTPITTNMISCKITQNKNAGDVTEPIEDLSEKMSYDLLLESLKTLAFDDGTDLSNAIMPKIFASNENLFQQAKDSTEPVAEQSLLADEGISIDPDESEEKSDSIDPEEQRLQEDVIRLRKILFSDTNKKIDFKSKYAAFFAHYKEYKKLAKESN